MFHNLDWNSILSMVMKAALSVLFLSIIPAAIKLLPMLPGITQHGIDWLKAHAGSVILKRVIDLAGQKVLALEQTEVAFIQQQAASGAISKDTIPGLLAGVKQKAIDSVMADVKSQGLSQQLLSAFTGSQEGLTKWLSDIIESHVAQLPSDTMKYVKTAPK